MMKASFLTARVAPAFPPDFAGSGMPDDAVGGSDLALFERVAALSPDAVFVHDLTTDRTLYANRHVADFLGMDQRQVEALGTGLLQTVVHPDDLGLLMQAKGQLLSLRDGGTVEHEFRVRAGDGLWRRVRSREVVLQRSADGRVTQIMGVIEDITREHEQAAALREAEARFHAMAEVTPVLMWVAGPDRRLLFCNRRVLDFTGLTLDQLQGGAWSNLIPEPERPAVQAEWQAAMSGGRDFVAEHLVTGAGGEVRWMLSRAVAYRDEEGRITRWFGSSTDIHDQKIATAEVMRAAERQEALLRELNHRIKNSLQLIASLLRLQAADIRDGRIQAVFDQACQRVTAVSEVHALLYMTEEFGTLDFGHYVSALAPRLVATIRDVEERVDVRVERAEGMLVVDHAIPMGLIANELLSNALRHAFPPGTRGRVRVGYHCDGRTGRFWVVDDGPAVHPAGSVQDILKEGLGLRMVRALAGQIGASFSIGRKGGLTRAEVSVPVSSKG